MSLEQLKKIRTRRMEQRFVELQEQRRILAEHELLTRQKQQELTDFAHWRLQHQEALFANLKNQPFAPQALFNYQKTLEDLRQQEERLQAELKEHFKGLETAETQVQLAQQQSSEANLKLEKLKEIIKLQGAKSSPEETVQ
ncbi:MAG: YscO family type III secretion system apparatus protein [Thiothrix sp.]